ncbi:MAG: hypothetical protein M3Y56_04825, partial [Armatimonadota bacterium]|nr:hypothetical protein [Armatimonadota bacterium]
MCLAKDKRGDIWAGTEDFGVWRYDPAAPSGKQWTQFTTKDGMGDNNAYALAVDRLGRVWVGHLNRGVSVYNGETWRNYDTTNGLLGSRVFAMAVCPLDGDVWISTESGLARYSESRDKWSYYTKSGGLPSDQGSSLAFDPVGNLYLGTQCDGIGIGSRGSNYRTWRKVAGLDQMPNAPGGLGFPTSVIHCLMVSRVTGTVYAGTNFGLA